MADEFTVGGADISDTAKKYTDEMYSKKLHLLNHEDIKNKTSKSNVLIAMSGRMGSSQLLMSNY
jgi:hypothetical protein